MPKLRILILAALASAVAVLAAAVGARLLMPASRAAALLERQVETGTGFDVRLGSASFTGLSTLRIASAELRAPGPDARPIASADLLFVRASLLPLLIGRVSVTDTEIVRPTATIERAWLDHWLAGNTPDAKDVAGNVQNVRIVDGRVNVVDASSPTFSATLSSLNLTLQHLFTEANVPFAGSANALWRGTAAALSFSGSYDVPTGGIGVSRLAISAHDASARFEGSVKRGKPMSLSFRSEWTGVDPSSFTALVPLPERLAVRGPTAGRLSFDTSPDGFASNVNLDLGACAVEWGDLAEKAPGTRFEVQSALLRKGPVTTLRDVAVRLASIALAGDGEIRDAGESGHAASLRLKTAEFDIGDLFEPLRVKVPDGLDLKGTATATVSIDGWTGGGRFVADVDGTQLEAAYRSVLRKTAGVPMRLLASGRYATPVAVDLSSLRLDVAGIRMSGRGSYTPGKVRPTYTFRLKTNAFRLASASALTPSMRRYRPTGRGVISLRVIRGDEGPATSGSLTLVSAGASVGGSSVTALAGTLRFTDDALSARGLTGRIDGSPLRVDLAAHRFGSRPFVEADVRVDEINLGKLLAGDAPDGARVSTAAFDSTGILRAGHIEHPDFAADDLTVEWTLASVRGAPEAVEGTVAWRQGPGRLGDVSALVAASRPTRFAFLPVAAAAHKGAFEAIDLDLVFGAGAARVAFVIRAQGRTIDVRGKIPVAETGEPTLTVQPRASK